MTTGHDHVMQCAEVFGGNRQAQTSIATLGLDAWLYSDPYTEDQSSDAAPESAGGDVHFLTSCATGRVTRLLLADVSGHGARVDRAARELKALLGSYAHYIDQLRFLAEVNHRFGTADTDGLFATAIVATYFSPTSELSVCSAGHPAPLLYDASQGSWREVPVNTPLEDDRPGALSNLPLGIEHDVEYAQSTIHLGERDLAMFYTDALPEARPPDGPMLGAAGVLDALNALDASDPGSIVPALLNRVNAHRAPAGKAPPFDDDVTVLIVRRNDRAPTPSLRTGILGAARVTAQAARTVLVEHRAPALPEWSLRNIAGAFFKGLN
ncbi:MAG: hypothetical protein DHS20C14_20620 [Phycisphaeraceae bacterium]|nr:MAG: hypothetical protein DHS20C14_20620 [Phycisphaeraceae bacterium]